MAENPLSDLCSPNPYLDTLARMEPDIAMIDSAAGWASIAISLKRIADQMELIVQKLDNIEMNIRPGVGR